MEKEKALKVMETIDCCVVPLSIAGGVRLGLNTYDIYRKCTGTKFRLTEALVFGLVCAPLGMYAANVYAEYVSRPMRKGIESVHQKEAAEQKDDISESEGFAETVKKKVTEYKKDIEEMFGDISEEPVEELSRHQLETEVGKATKLSDWVKEKGGTREECKRANLYTIGVMSAKTKTEIRDLMKEFGIRELQEKYQPELYSHEVSEEE